MLRLLVALTAIVSISVPLMNAQTLQITAPPDRTIVHPGETVVVKVVASPDTTFSFLTVTGSGEVVRESKIPAQFNVPIPAEACCGTRLLTAAGSAKGRRNRSIPRSCLMSSGVTCRSSLNRDPHRGSISKTLATYLFHSCSTRSFEMAAALTCVSLRASPSQAQIRRLRRSIRAGKYIHCCRAERLCPQTIDWRERVYS